MPGKGRVPQNEHTRERNNHTMTEMEFTGELYGDPLPEGVLPDEEEWHPMTIQWWDAVRSNPLMANETPMGWQFLIDTALMHHTMWAKGRWDFASEVRLRVAKYGVTPEDRQRLKITIKTGGEPEKKGNTQPEGDNVRSISNRRARLA